VTVLDRGVSEAEVVNTTTETTVYSFTVPGGTLGTNGMLRITFLGSQLNNSGGNAGLTFRLSYGGTVIGFSDTTVTPDADRGVVWGEAYLAAVGATNSQRSFSRVGVTAGVANVVANPPTVDTIAIATAFSSNNGLAIDSTQNQTLAITAQWGTAAATISYLLQMVVVEKL
jgi:hypothetical protein